MSPQIVNLPDGSVIPADFDALSVYFCIDVPITPQRRGRSAKVPVTNACVGLGRATVSMRINDMDEAVPETVGAGPDSALLPSLLLNHSWSSWHIWYLDMARLRSVLRSLGLHMPPRAFIGRWLVLAAGGTAAVWLENNWIRLQLRG